MRRYQTEKLTREDIVSQSSESSPMRPRPGLFLKPLIVYGSNRVVTTNFSSIAKSMLH